MRIKNIKIKKKLRLLSLRKKVANLEKVQCNLQKETIIMQTINPTNSENFYPL